MSTKVVTESTRFLMVMKIYFIQVIVRLTKHTPKGFFYENVSKKSKNREISEYELRFECTGSP